jgi:hypothetical protein
LSAEIISRTAEETYMYTIEKNVDPPAKAVRLQMPLKDLEIGDSFLVKIPRDISEATVRQRMHRFQKKNPGVRLSLRRVDAHFMRLFRVEDQQ